MSLYDIIGYPFGFLMSFIYGIFGNYAVSIIVFTIVTKILLFPVNYKTQKNSARMQLLNPKMEKLRKSFANNPQRLQEEQQKLYQQEGINPMASCLPAFIQMFLLFGVLDVVYKPITHILHITKSIRQEAVRIASDLVGGKGISLSDLRCELRTMEQVEKSPEAFGHLAENFLGSIQDFSSKFTVFGANLGQTPQFHPDVWNREAVILFLIPVFAGLAQLIQSIYSMVHQKRTNPDMQGNGCMTFMMLFMPLWSVWLAFEVPAGVGFYWIWSSVFSFLINLGLNIYFTPERTERINEKEKERARVYAEKHPEKKTFMQKMMEQQALYEQEQRAQSARFDENGDKISRSEMNRQNRDRINDARARMSEKYGDDSKSGADGDSLSRIEEARRRMAEKYGDEYRED